MCAYCGIATHRNTQPTVAASDCQVANVVDGGDSCKPLTSAERHLSRGGQELQWRPACGVKATSEHAHGDFVEASPILFTDLPHRLYSL